MNLQTWANLGEALGGLAIVITLIYVGIELRLNTRSNKARTSYEGAHSWAEVTMGLMNDPDLAGPRRPFHGRRRVRLRSSPEQRAFFPRAYHDGTT
jgi:hypothetical protein